MDYWLECIKEAFEDAKIAATQEQIDTVTGWVEGAVENEGLARGYVSIPNPVKLENDKLKSELEKERNKQICNVCNGTGCIITAGPVHSAESSCYKCNGNGRY